MTTRTAPQAPVSMQTDPVTHGYAAVNGLQMYYEIHGSGRPLVLLHGAMSAIGTSFGQVLPALALGSGVALQIAIRHPDLVRKLVVASVTYNNAGFHPGLLVGIATLQPEHLAGTPWAEEYARIAPHPGAWPALIAKIKQLDGHDA